MAPLAGDVGERIEALRRRWDPLMAARIRAHVTLVYESVAIERLRTAAAATPPIRLRLGDPARWETDPGIYLPVADPQGDLGRFRAAAGAMVGYAPHVTILHRDSVTTSEQLAEAWAALSHERFDADVTVRHVLVYDEVSREHERAVWRESARLALAAS